MLQKFPIAFFKIFKNLKVLSRQKTTSINDKLADIIQNRLSLEKLKKFLMFDLNWLKFI